MAMTARHAADEEARAEVDVLSSRLEKTARLTKKIQASLTRLETSGKSVEQAIGPIYGNTQRLQVLGRNIDQVLHAIERVRQPSDIKNNEEEIIRGGPDAVGLSAYLKSLDRVNRAISELKATNMKANQQALLELNRLVQVGNHQLETIFRRILQEDAEPVEPLNFITKSKPWPLLSQEKTGKLGLINNCIAASVKQTSGVAKIPPEAPTSNIYVKIRAPYLLNSLTNLAAASVNTAKKTNSDVIYKQGSNGIGMYAQALEGAFIAEYENVTQLFPREDWRRVFIQTTGPSMDDMTQAFKDLNTHIRAHITTDCFLAYEIIDIMFTLMGKLEKRTGELKERFTVAMKPIKDTGKSSLSELLDDTRKQVASTQMLEKDVSILPVTSETMSRLLTMVDYLRPLQGIMISLGPNGWKKPATTSEAPSLADFDPNADGKGIFAAYAADTIDTLISSVQSKGQQTLKTKQLQGVFLANNLTVVRRSLRDSDLGPLLAGKLQTLDVWRKKATSLYMDPWRDCSKHLMDVQLTSSNKSSKSLSRPISSGTSTSHDSAAIVKSLSSKEKDVIKEKFTSFNASFQELVNKHKGLSMEREVRESFARDVQQMIEPLYTRFYDRYHEMDRGRGKYVKFDKAALVAIFQGLAKP